MMPPPEIIFSGRMAMIHEGLTRRQVDTFGLVLSSADVEYRTVRTSEGWQIWVPKHVENGAATAIAAYLSENDDTGESSPAATWPVTRTLAGVWMVLILMAVHLAVTASGQAAVLRRIYGASAEQILNGELYRITTALLLHADGLHLAGNMVGIALFATAVCSTAGFGAGGLMILVAGMTGNLLNALLFKTGHHSIGASTAVFGAVAIAAAHQLITKWRSAGQRFKAWIPLGGGLAFLGLMGSSTNTDLTAHFFGFMTGFLIGLVFTATRKGPPEKSAQYGCLLMMVVLVSASFVFKR